MERDISDNTWMIKDMVMEYKQTKMKMTQKKMCIMDNTIRVTEMVMDAKCLLIVHIMDSSRMINIMEKEFFMSMVKFTKRNGKITNSSVKFKFESAFT